MIKKNLTLFVFLILSISTEIFSQQECFLLMAGKKTTVSGDILLAHNNDLTGTEASMLIRVQENDTLNILPEKQLKYQSTSDMLVLQTYLGYREGDAVAINRHSVAIAGGLSLKKDRSLQAEKIDPLIKNGLGGGIRYFALRHAKTARECIKIIGKCFDKFGISYPSGFGIADTNEIWYLEIGGGKSWAAIKIPDSMYFVGANSYRIDYIDLSDTVNYMFSSNLKKIAENSNIFYFADFFGGGVKEKDGNNYYNTRRIWKALNKFTSSGEYSANDHVFPVYLKPDNKITLQDCFAILRDYYQNTEYSNYIEGEFNERERAISVWRTVHTNVISLSPAKPIDYGAIIWTGLSSPYTAIYIPVYFGCISLPEAYTFAPEKFNSSSAFWKFKELGDLSKKNFPYSRTEWITKRNELEKNIIKKHDKIIKKITNLQPDERKTILENSTNHFSIKALEHVEQISMKLKRP